MSARRTFIFYSIIWMSGLVFSLTKGKLAGSVSPVVAGADLIIVLSAYLFLRGGVYQAGVFAFVQGLCMDVYSAGFEGLFVFLYLCSLGVVAIASGFIHLGNPRGQVLIVAMAWIAKEALFFVAVATLAGQLAFSSAQPRTLALSFILSVVLAPVVFYFLDRLRLSIGLAKSHNGILQGH